MLEEQNGTLDEGTVKRRRKADDTMVAESADDTTLKTESLETI